MPNHRLAKLVGDGSWAAATQIISSATNFTVSLVLARQLGPAEFGSFAVVFALWLLILGFSRALLTQPYVIVASPQVDDLSRWRNQTNNSAGMALGWGIAFGIIGAAIAIAVNGSSPITRTVLALALFAGPLVLQDFLRFAAFSGARPKIALAAEATWAVTLSALLLILSAYGALSSATGMLAWGAGAAVGATMSCLCLQIIPRPRFHKFARWLNLHGRLGGAFAAAAVLYNLGTQGSLLIISNLLGTGAAGGLRSVENIVAPAMVLMMAAELYGLPVAARRSTDRISLGQLAWRYSVGLSILVGFWGTLITLSGRTLLTIAFGNEFTPFADLLLPVAISSTLIAASSGAGIGLRVGRAGSKFVVAHLSTAAFKLVGVGALTPLTGLRGAAWAMTGANAVHAILLWYLFSRSAKDMKPSEAFPGS